MIKTLKDTTSQGIAQAVMEARHNLGATSGMVFTLIVVTDLHDFDDVMDACVVAGREHPSRILVVTNGTARADRLDAEVHLGDDVPGEIIALRFQGELTRHRDSVILPLLLPDSPVVVWWPGESPESLASDPIGALAKRRISDAMGAKEPLSALRIRAAQITPGDTDLTWTRLTPWRALLTASLDQYPEKVSAARVEAARDNAAGLLLAAWLRSRLRVPVEFVETTVGPGITAVEMDTVGGVIRIARTDGRMATYETPRTPRRLVALRRRSVNQLITEELRRIDTDDVFQQAMASLLQDFETADGHPTGAPTARARGRGRQTT